MKLAVIGKDVSASESPAMHTFIARNMGNSVSYAAVSVPEENFEREIGGILRDYDGLNVTIPYKLAVMPHLKVIRGDAQAFGAVNTVLCGELAGENTDGLGFMLMLTNNGISVAGQKVLVLGAGGAGRSVVKKLAAAGASVSVYDKNAESARSAAAQCGAAFLGEVRAEKYRLIVNATGVGMHGTVGLSPVGEEVIAGCDAAVDLIYVPEQSEFLRLAEKCGKKTVNGKAMLFYQAYYAECLFFGAQPSEGQAKELFEKYLKEGIRI